MTDKVMQDAQRVADELIGTACSMQEVLERLEIEETVELCQAFDQLAFICAACGWWCEAGEANENPDGSGEDVCDDCKED